MNMNHLKKVAVVLFFVMFVYSGIMKIFKFNKKVKVLQKKTKLPLVINQIGMVGVILLEIVGSCIILFHYLFPNKMIPLLLVKIVKLLFLIFLVVVTLLYHPPSKKMMIPFLSNLTTFAGLLYMFSDL